VALYEPKETALWTGYNEGVRWEPSLEAAKRTGQPILHFQVVGDLDREGC
jgi:hypothetical protein